MSVDPIRPIRPAGAEPSEQRVKPEPRTERDEPKDGIELSPEARLVRLHESDPAKRAELVERLRREVDAGTYRPDADEVASRMVEERGV